MDFLLTDDYWRLLLTPQAQVSLTEKLIIVAVVWFTMGRKVSARFKGIEDRVDATLKMFETHLKNVEDKLEQALDKLRSVRDTIAHDLSAHTESFNRLDGDLKDVKKRVTNLEDQAIRKQI